MAGRSDSDRTICIQATRREEDSPIVILLPVTMHFDVMNVQWYLYKQYWFIFEYESTISNLSQAARYPIVATFIQTI